MNPTSIKQKLIAALDIALEDVGEDRLLDILLDAYASKKREIEKLKNENAGERQYLRKQHDDLVREQHRLRSDPTYGARGEYFFAREGGYKFRVSVTAGGVDLFEYRLGVEYCILSLSPGAWAAK